MTFLELAKSRCTTRGFTPQAIPGADIDYILNAGRAAPTACNRQPQRIIVLQSADALEKVKKAYETFNAPCVFIVCRDTRDELIRPWDGKCSGDIDMGIVSDHMMLAARERGIGSVLVGLFDPHIVRREFGMPGYIEPTTLLILGYPEKGFLASDRHDETRKPLSETVMYEEYNERVIPPIA